MPAEGEVSGAPTHQTTAPCHDHVAREVVAAINMAANKATIDIEQLVGHLAPHLISTADRISARLGYRREDEPHSPVSRLYHLEAAAGDQR